MPALHHIAFACRDPEATHHFYEDLLGFPLAHAEMDRAEDGGWLKHTFYDLGDGSYLAFFDLHGMGEPQDLRTEISTGLGLPFWVNHVAVRVDAARRDHVRQRLADVGVVPEMELDHGWCHSMYVTDPNGILVELTVDTTGIQADPAAARQILDAPPPPPPQPPAAPGPDERS